MPHILAPLPYAFDALEPYIDTATMRLHHGKHHQTYVDKLNAALEGHPDLQAKSLEELLRGIALIPEEIRGVVRNHGGGHANHSTFWTTMKQGGGGEPGEVLGAALQKHFSDMEKFRDTFTKAAVGLFGSGWVWLVLDQSGSLQITTRPNQESPLMDNLVPLLGLDVWEHAYYLKYQNRRTEYVVAWWNVVNWADVSERFVRAQHS